jgi:amidase
MVRRLRQAGAIVVGKTTTPEYAIWPFTETPTWGKTRNPWDLERTPGGSSGGSAAAVAAGLVAAATASDGGGSIRIPAACCGLFGLKPQRGRVSLAPHGEHWHGLSVNGGLTRSVADGALYLDVVAGNVAGDADRVDAPATPFAQAAATQPGKLRIAASRRTLIPGTPIKAEPRAAYEQTIELLRSLGHEVVEQDPAFGNDLLPAFTARYLRGIRDDVETAEHPDRLESRTRGMARGGQLISDKRLAKARAAEQKISARIGRLFEEFDVLLTPALAQLPIPVGRYESRGALWTFNSVGRFTPFTPPWNFTGQPAATVPALFTDGGLPVSVQIVGRRADEATLISLAAQLEAERPWADRRPPVS